MIRNGRVGSEVPFRDQRACAHREVATRSPVDGCPAIGFGEFVVSGGAQSIGNRLQTWKGDGEASTNSHSPLAVAVISQTASTASSAE